MCMYVTQNNVEAYDYPSRLFKQKESPSVSELFHMNIGYKVVALVDPQGYRKRRTGLYSPCKWARIRRGWSQVWATKRQAIRQLDAGSHVFRLQEEAEQYCESVGSGVPGYGVLRVRYGSKQVLRNGMTLPPFTKGVPQRVALNTHTVVQFYVEPGDYNKLIQQLRGQAAK